MKKPQSIVVLTGAGISAESGIKTFRDANGLWKNHRVEQVASPNGFATYPELVHEFYNQRRRQLLSVEVKENQAHKALARLEREFKGEFLLVTQNVDDLHERAGSRSPIHMHGEILKKRCNRCEVITAVRTDLTTQDVCESCGQTGSLRPHIVWFGEMPMEMERIQAALESCDCFISIGTSGHVYPAAGFVAVASSSGASTVSLNLEPSNNESAFGRCEYGPATEIVPTFVESFLKH